MNRLPERSAQRLADRLVGDGRRDPHVDRVGGNRKLCCSEQRVFGVTHPLTKLGQRLHGQPVESFFRFSVGVFCTSELAQPAMDRLSYEGRWPVEVELGQHAQHLPDDALLDANISAHRAGRLEALAQQTRHAVKRGLHGSG